MTEADAFLRLPLALVDPSGPGLRLTPGRTAAAFARGVLARRGWSWRERFALLADAARWAARRLRLRARRDRRRADAGLPARVRAEFIEPLCVAALNTPAERRRAARVFLRVLRDAPSPGRARPTCCCRAVDSAPCCPSPPLAWLRARGATIRLGSRVRRSRRDGAALGGRRQRSFDRVVVAASADRGGAPGRPVDARPGRSARPRLRYEPIVTVYATSAGTPPAGADAAAARRRRRAAGPVRVRPRALGGPAGLLAFVISGARAWVERGVAGDRACGAGAGRGRLERACSRGAARPCSARSTRSGRRSAARRRWTRPAAAIAPACVAAGDYVDGPYPATLEGAVRSGLAAAGRRHGLTRPASARIARCETSTIAPSPSRCSNASSRCSTCWPRIRSRCR